MNLLRQKRKNREGDRKLEGRGAAGLQTQLWGLSDEIKKIAK